MMIRGHLLSLFEDDDEKIKELAQSALESGL
jgi:hypothetical protein